MRTWALQDAKNRFSEVVNDALSRGPQYVSRHGKNTVVVLSVKDYRRLTGSKGLLKLLRSCPVHDLTIERSKDLPRDIEL